MSRSTTRALGALLLAGALTAVGHGAAAQETYSDAQLDSFTDAAMQVNEIAAEYRPQIEGAGSEEEAQTLMQEAGTEMEAAIEDADGITVDEYKQIVESARNDPQLRDRIGRILQDKAGG